MMRNFLIKISFFAFIIFLIDNVFSYALQYARPIDYKLFIDAKKELFKKDKYYDILIIGDSHISDALDTRIIENNLNMTAFNLGVYHASPYECYYLTVAALNHLVKKPKIIIIGTNPASFNKEAKLRHNYTPLIINDYIISWELHLSSREPLDASFFLKLVKEKYLFQSLLGKILGNKYHPTREIRTTYNGYLETTNYNDSLESTKQQPQIKAKPFEFKKVQINYFNKTIALIMKQNIKIIFVNTPNSNKRKITNGILDSISNTYKIPYFNADYTVLEKNLIKKDFLNAGHLNCFGAKKFTTELVNWIRINNLQ